MVEKYTHIIDGFATKVIQGNFDNEAYSRVGDDVNDGDPVEKDSEGIYQKVPVPEYLKNPVWDIENGEYIENPYIRYDEKRKDEYPSIGDQLDTLWHAMDDGTITKVPAFYDPIKAVKDKHPKG